MRTRGTPIGNLTSQFFANLYSRIGGQAPESPGRFRSGVESSSLMTATPAPSIRSSFSDAIHFDRVVVDNGVTLSHDEVHEGLS